MQRVLLQEHQQAQQGLQDVSITDHLEYVDGSTGFTPLVAAVHWHRIQAARTVRCSIPLCFPIPCQTNLFFKIGILSLPCCNHNNCKPCLLHKLYLSRVCNRLQHNMRAACITPKRPCMALSCLTARVDCMQLLEHGADVHSHTANIAQTPLRLAVDDVNLDSKMIELLVSYGASPFLEAKDGDISFPAAIPVVLMYTCASVGFDICCMCTG